MTTPTTPDVALPATMIEAAARAWLAFFRDDEQWDELQPWDQDNYLEAARLALTAALSVCEVREQWRAFFTDGATTVWMPSDQFIIWRRWRNSFRDSQSLAGSEWCLSITTPAEPVDTEGAAT